MLRSSSSPSDSLRSISSTHRAHLRLMRELIQSIKRPERCSSSSLHAVSISDKFEKRRVNFACCTVASVVVSVVTDYVIRIPPHRSKTNDSGDSSLLGSGENDSSTSCKGGRDDVDNRSSRSGDDSTQICGLKEYGRGDCIWADRPPTTAGWKRTQRVQHYAQLFHEHVDPASIITLSI